MVAKKIMTKQDKGLIIFITILTIIVFMPFEYLIWHSQLLNEQLSCDKDYKCEVKITRLFNVKTTHKFTVYKKSRITNKYRYESNGGGYRGRGIKLYPTGHMYFIVIDGKQPFEFPICQYYYDIQIAPICISYVNSVSSEFDKYKLGLTDDFVLTSRANKLNCFWLYTIMLLILWLFIVIGMFITESDFFKKYRINRKHK